MGDAIEHCPTCDTRVMCHMERRCMAFPPVAGSPRYQDLERWIREAAPLLETATCIVIDENIERLSEIAGVRAVLETCPIDFTDNVKGHAPLAESERGQQRKGENHE